MKKVKPLKKFSQNYLIDKNIIKKIVDQLELKKEDCLVEIGPGIGSITEILVDKCDNLILIEIDTRVIEHLTSQFQQIKIINDDFLKVDLSKVSSEFCNKKKLRFTGNIPFNITSPILFKLFEYKTIIKDAVFIMPFDIAKKLNAKPKTKEYGILTVLTNYFLEPKILFKISPNVFRPQPKILSAAVHLKSKSRADKLLDEKLFITVVKSAFGNRRKTLKNSLSNSIFEVYNYSGIKLDITKRAEEFELKDFIYLTKYFQEQINAKQ